MQTWQDVFKLFKSADAPNGSASKLAAALGCIRQTAWDMMRRGSIPPARWPTLIAWAEENKVRGISAASLGRLANGTTARLPPRR